MSISIQTNVNSLVAQQNMNVNNTFQSKTIQQLTSGYRINQSGDDAAGLAVANKFRSSVAELTQGVANGNDGVAQLQIMDGGMSNISQILDRLKTLATQSASGAFTGNRDALNGEFQTDLQEIDRQAQSIGLDTGGTFAKSLSVYMGVGSGSASLSNGIVALDLSASTVDSQSLGLKGMQVVNAALNSSGATDLVNADIGTSSTTSVQNIVGNTSGAHANQQAVAGYAAFQFSGAGFSDAGKVAISVNLDGVSNVATLATAVNNAIQSAANGGTAAANAFKGANIVASVYTDRNGGQALAFSSSTSAFQAQAGDQMGNALLGNVSVVGGVAQGAAVTTSMQGAVTAAGTGFATPTQVHLVVDGGGLAQAVSLQLNASSSTTEAAIADLQSQFQSNAALVAAGLTMSNTAGGNTVGGHLTFTSASGQSFNVQVTGDSQNMLGLGSFLSDSSGNADYKTITGTSAYDPSAVTGDATTTGLASGLEISLNGQSSIALTPIDLTAGAHAVAASATSSASVASGAVDITATNANLDITVTNNGVATNHAFALTTNQVATGGARASTVLSSQDFAGSPITVAAASHNNQFTVAVDGGSAVTLTVADGSYGTAGAFLTAIQGAISGSSLAGSVTAGWAAGANALTLTSVATGVASSVGVGAATYTTSAAIASTVTSANIAGSPVTVAAASNNNKFDVAVDGGSSVTLTVADGAYSTAGAFLTAIQAAISGSTLTGLVTAGWATGTNALTLTSISSGAASAVSVSATSGNTGLANVGLTAATNHGQAAAVNSGMGNVGLSAGASSGLADAPSTVQSIAAQIQTQFGGNATVTVTNDNKIGIASTTKGANSSVTINTPGSNSANGTLHLGSPTLVAGQNSSIADIVDNLNAQFGASSTFQAAGLKAAATLSTGTGSGNYITVSSNANNQTQFRLNALGAGAPAAEDIGFGVAGSSFTSATPGATTAMKTVDAYGTSATGAQTFNALQYGNESQVLTFSATDSSGALETKSITLQNNAAGNRAGRSVDDAVAYINQQLQASGVTAALQSIVAVKEVSGGSEKINFVSSLAGFTVGVGGVNTGSTDGLNGGSQAFLQGAANGSAANMSIGTQEGAQAAVTAISAAIAKLGSAQAAVGKGENQLGYAINLAQSQITNFSAAESQIRDANIAQQAANLTKAQVLQQAAIAAMAQANSAPQAVLKLLQG